MRAADIRSQNDLQLFGRLLEHPDVKRVNELIEKRAEEGPMGVRRHLLSTSVRLSRRMGKTIHKLADECIEKLMIDIPLELFVYSSPHFNAVCFKPENDRLYVMFSSSLLEAFTGNELKFVIGHELGHYIYRHHDIPIGQILRGNQRPDPKLALDLFAWSRYAEISADRAGANCASELDSVARALFRLASGLRGDVIEFSLQDFLRQVDDMQVDDEEPGPGPMREDWFSTHPFSPLRVKALELFFASEFAVAGGSSVELLETSVTALMGLMEPSYLEGRTDAAEIMRRLLFAGAIALANADGNISESEIELFERFFGAGSFGEHLDLTKLQQDLPDRTAQARENLAAPRRMQVLRDLCLIANAEAAGAQQKRQMLHDLARELDVSAEFIEQTMDAEVELD
jgi:uncharacterized tellurite resistance protein B-like protein